MSGLWVCLSISPIKCCLVSRVFRPRLAWWQFAVFLAGLSHAKRGWPIVDTACTPVSLHTKKIHFVLCLAMIWSKLKHAFDVFAGVIINAGCICIRVVMIRGSGALPCSNCAMRQNYRIQLHSEKKHCECSKNVFRMFNLFLPGKTWQNWLKYCNYGKSLVLSYHHFKQKTY